MAEPALHATRMKALPTAALLAAFILNAAAPAGARRQDPQQPAPIFRAGVKLVRVDVSVTGRDNEVVANLKASDFEVEEDGIPQTVETLQFVRLDGTRTSETEESLDIRSPEHAAMEAARDDVRLFVIFLDDYHVEKTPSITLPLRRALADLVQRFGPNDLVAIVDPLTPLSHVRFTRSQRDLLERVEQFEGRLHQIFPVKSVIEEAQLTMGNVWEIRGGVTLSALEAIVTHLGGLREGRKSVIFVSQGPNMGGGGMMGGVGATNEHRLTDVLQSANRANVTIHVFDPRPLGRAPLGGSFAMHQLYSQTGGRAIINTNAPENHFDEIFTDASAYYLLGYSPSRDLNDGKFHRIDVRVKRRGVRVLARRGYWAPTAEEANPAIRVTEVEGGVIEALTELLEPKDGRAADVWIGATMGPEAFTRLMVAWEPTGRASTGKAARLMVERLRRGDDDDGPPERHTLGVTGGALPLTALFDIDAGTEASLRFTVEGADGSVVDQWDETVRVPALSGRRLALSTAKFLRARSAFEAQAIAAGQDPPPAASRRFQVRDRVLVEVECYGPATPALAARLLNARGERLVDLDVPPLAGGKTRLTLPVSSLAPGTYVLRLEATAGEEQIQSRAAFRIVP